MIKKLIPVLMLGFSMAANAQAATSVVVRPVKELSNEEPVRVNGVVRSRHDVLLSAGTDGELQFVAEEGTTIQQGTVVARLETEQLDLRLREQKLLAARASVNVDYLNGEVERLSRLERQNLASKTRLEEIISRRDLAVKDHLVSEARVDQIEENILRTRIVSPVDGIIVERLRQQGEFARRGEAVVRVVNDRDLEIRASVPVSLFTRLKRRADVSVSVSGLDFEGRLRSIIGAGEENSQTFHVLVDVPKAVAGKIVPGQFAEVSMPLMAQERSLFVPRDAVVLRSDGSYVFRIDEQNKAKRVDVSLGQGQGDLVAVSGDLKHGDRVAIRGVERLEDGQKVDPGTG